MDLSSITPNAVLAQKTLNLQGEFATGMLRKVLDTEATQAALLIQMAQSSGVGTAIDTRA